jgi:nucleoside-diphosphate-sugar epimerase
MNETRVAIIGAAGQVGSNLLAELSRDPDLKVWGVVRNRFSAGFITRTGLDVRIGTVTEGSGANDLLGDADVIINCTAAAGLPATARRDDERMLSSILSVPGQKRLIHFSSVGVHGWCCDARRTTFEKPAPDWTYGRDKLHLEHFLRSRAKATKHDVVVLRLGHVYGAAQWVTRFLLTFASARRLLPFDGRLPSNAVHVKNAVAGVHALVKSTMRTGTFNLFDPGNTTWRALADWHTRAAGLAPIGALDGETSDRFAHLFRRSLWSKMRLELGTAARGLPVYVLNNVPALKQVGLSALALSKAPAIERFAMRRMTQLSAGPTSEVTYTERYLFSDGAPGPELPYPSVLGAEDARDVARWWEGLTSFDALVDSAEPHPISEPSASTAAAEWPA